MIVVDCAALVDALTGAQGCVELRRVLAGEDLHAPSLLDYEVVSALRGLLSRGHLSITRALEALSDYDALPIRRWDGTGGLRQRAFTLRDNLSAYDAAYVVLAEALQCPLITRDGRLARSVGHAAQIRVL